MKLVVCFKSPRQRLRDIKTHNSFHKYSMKWKFISDPIFILQSASRIHTHFLLISTPLWILAYKDQVCPLCSFLLKIYDIIHVTQTIFLSKIEKCTSPIPFLVTQYIRIKNALIFYWFQLHFGYWLTRIRFALFVHFCWKYMILYM